EETVTAVKRKAEELGVEIAAYLERAYGRLCELALDLAIDRKGQIFLLEVNPKPSREVFIQAGERETYRRAIIRPLEYAVWMYDQKQKREKAKTAAEFGKRFDGMRFDGTEAGDAAFDGSRFEGSRFDRPRFDGTRFEGSRFGGSRSI